MPSAAGNFQYHCGSSVLKKLAPINAPTAKAGELVLAMAVAGADGGSTIGQLTMARLAMLMAEVQSAGRSNPHWRQRQASDEEPALHGPACPGATPAAGRQLRRHGH